MENVEPLFNIKIPIILLLITDKQSSYTTCIISTQIILGNCIEHFVTKYRCRKSPFKPLGEAGSSKFCPTVPAWVARTGYHLRWYFIGLLINLIITDTAKIVVGRLRPNFIDICKPDFSQFNCTDVYGNPVYVTNYVCTGDPSMVPDTRYARVASYAH
jgi:hypothetical protein